MPTTVTELRRKISSAPTNVLDNLDHWHPSNSSTPRTQDHVPSHIREGHVLKDTFTSTHLVDDPSYQAGTIDEKQSPELDDLGHTIPEIDLEFFLGNILPPLRDGLKPTETIDGLEKDGYITDCHWKLFDAEPRSMQGTREQSVLGHLANLFDRIVQAANERPHSYTQTLVLRTELNWTPSETDIVNRPDGCMVLKGAEDLKASWYDFGLTMEVKREHVDFCEDNVGKQVFNMQYLMSLDPCRRSAFGITIENCNMRLWFCSRAVVLASGCFNFRTDIETLVRVFLSLAFASKTELGWDPTISVTTEDDIRVYHFTVKDENFDSFEVLSELGADAVIGRATRVFKVKKRDETLAVLKDVWIDDDRKPEHKIRSKILADIQKKFGEDIRKGVAKYLLTPIAYDFVKVDGRVDHTTEVLMRGAFPSLSKTFDLIIVKPVFEDAQCSTGFPQASDQIAYEVMREPRKRIHHRVHYRIVFREIGLPLHQVKKLSDVFTVLGDVSRVLEYIHGCGWVHRDISAGNVYLYDNGRGLPRGLLGDLEYAKKMGTDVECEVRTGTRTFMVIEVESQEYKFTPEEEDEGTRVVRQYESRMDTVREREEFSDIEEEPGSDSTEDSGDASDPDIDEDSSDVDGGLNEAEDSADGSHEDPDSAEGGLGDSNEGQSDTMEDLSGQRNDEVHFLDKSVKTTQVLRHGDKQYASPVLIYLVYNCLHDMESIWWAAIWMLFLHEDSSEKGRRSEADRSSQMETVNVLFSQRLDSAGRFDFFMSKFAFGRRAQCLPQSFKDIVKHPGSLRSMLRIRYTQAEATLPKIDKEAFKGVHGIFTRALEAARDESHNIGIERIVKPSEVLTLPKKRKAGEALLSSTNARRRSRSLKSGGSR